MKKITSLLFLAILASCSGGNNSKVHDISKSKDQMNASSTDSPSVEVDETSPTTTLPLEEFGSYEDEEVIADTIVEVDNSDQDYGQNQDQAQTSQTSQIPQDTYVDKLGNYCKSLSIDKHGDYMLTSVLEEGRVELNSNVACLIRTAYTPEIVKVKMMTNMHTFKDLKTYEDHIDFVIGGRDKCEFQKSSSLVQDIKDNARMNGCMADVQTRPAKDGYEALQRVVIHSCSGQYGYDKCNRFKSTIKTCLKTKSNVAKLDFSKAKQLTDGEVEVYYVRLDQRRKLKNVSDFSIYEILDMGVTRKDHISTKLRKDSFKIRND